MNFKIAKKEFLDRLTLSCRAISNTTPLPSLTGIKISVTENSLVLISSDSNISIKTCVNNNDTSTLIINEPGEIVIDAKYIIEIVRKIDSDFVNVEIIDGNLVKIFGGKSEYKINCMNVNEYPDINFEVNNDNPFKLKTELFNQIINKTSFACSDKETRPVLVGINLKAENKKIYANATDSYRLASKVIDIDNENIKFNITVPNKYLSEVYHSITNEDEIVISIDNQKISFIFGNSIIQTRLIDDEFPDTSKLVPNEFNQTLVVDSKELNNAIDRTSFIKSEGKNIIKMKINSQKIELTTENQVGSSFEQVSIISYEGTPLEISCSGKYLQDAIKAIDSDNVTIKFCGELKPMVVQNSDDDSLIQLISPVRTYH